MTLRSFFNLQSHQCTDKKINSFVSHQVGHLGEEYQEWIHQPIVCVEGPRFFQSDFWEVSINSLLFVDSSSFNVYVFDLYILLCETFEQFLTRTVWWAIPTIWLPVVCYVLSISAARGLTFPQMGLIVAFGVFTWTLLEYTLHRFLFHIETKSYWLVQYQWSMQYKHNMFLHEAYSVFFFVGQTLHTIFFMDAITSTHKTAFVLFSLPPQQQSSWFQ